MTYIRGSRHDYDRWSSVIGCKGWSYDDVLPYFIKSESNTNKEFLKSGLVAEIFAIKLSVLLIHSFNSHVLCN